MNKENKSNATTVPIVSIVGKSDCGKTTFLEKLIKEAKQRNWRVATVKHDVHGFQMDKPGKDTWRHGEAGADIVVISSPQKIAILETVQEDQKLDAVVSRLQNIDIVFTEGYRSANKLKIEVFRSAQGPEPLCAPEELIAIASDIAVANGVPGFGLDDAAGICDLIEERCGLR